MSNRIKPLLQIATDKNHLLNLHTEPQDDVPKGKIRLVETHLEMKSYKPRKQKKQRLENLSIIRAHNPTVSFYRYLYNTVGEPWFWYERRLISDTELSELINKPDVRIYVLYVQGTPAGYTELDFTDSDNVEIAYFGLIPDFIGRGLGLYFLDWIVATAWSENPERIWVHTCNLDHPAAIAIYQKAGLSPFKQEMKIIDHPKNYKCFQG